MEATQTACESFHQEIGAIQGKITESEAVFRAAAETGDMALLSQIPEKLSAVAEGKATLLAAYQDKAREFLARHFFPDMDSEAGKQAVSDAIEFENDGRIVVVARSIREAETSQYFPSLIRKVENLFIGSKFITNVDYLEEAGKLYIDSDATNLVSMQRLQKVTDLMVYTPQFIPFPSLEYIYGRISHQTDPSAKEKFRISLPNLHYVRGGDFDHMDIDEFPHLETTGELYLNGSVIHHPFPSLKEIQGPLHLQYSNVSNFREIFPVLEKIDGLFPHDITVSSPDLAAQIQALRDSGELKFDGKIVQVYDQS